MSILMEHKDYMPDGAGSIASAEGGNDILNDILFRLTARRGGFALLPELGSRMYLLPSAKPSQRAALARQYAAEALADLTGVTVENARVTPTETGLNIRVDLIRQGEALSVELEESV